MVKMYKEASGVLAVVGMYLIVWFAGRLVGFLSLAH